MASGFPYNSSGTRIIDAFSNPTAGNNLSSPNHANLHTDVNDAITRLETVAQNKGGRNLLYNGAMQIYQRGSSTASIAASGYYTADRWSTNYISLGTWTQSVETDAPTGSGFARSLKMLCTANDVAPAAGDVLFISQTLEGLDVQGIRKGTSAAEQMSLSFWVKSTNTGTFIVEAQDSQNTRQISKAYTISAANTWEFKTVTFPADTTGAFANNNTAQLRLGFYLGAGSAYTSGSLNSSAWANTTLANTAVGQVNLAASVNNSWQITGVQLSVGGTVSPFEFKSFTQELRECQRYYEKSYDHSVAPATANVGGAMFLWEQRLVNDGGATYRHVNQLVYKVSKRATPTVSFWSQAGTSNRFTINRAGNSGTTGYYNIYVAASADSSGAISINDTNENGVIVLGIHNALTTLGFSVVHWAASAEL